MSSTATLSATLVEASGLLPATADTSFTAPTNVTTLLTAGASGIQIYEIVFQGVGTTVAGLINVFQYDGSTYHLWDSLLITAVTPSTTVQPWRAVRRPINLMLINTWSLRVTGTVAGNQSLVKITATGGAF